MSSAWRRAIRKGLRTTVALCAAFAIGRWGLDDQQAAVFAAFTALAMVGIADFVGPVRARLRANLTGLAAAFVLAVVGTVLSDTTWAATLAMFVVALVVSFAQLGGGSFVGGANAVMLFYLVATGIPGPDDLVGSRLAGIAIGGALACLAVLVDRERPERAFRRLLAGAIRALADLIEMLAAPGASSTDPARSAASARPPAELRRRAHAAATSVAAAQPFLETLTERPAGPSAIDRAQVYLAYCSQRIVELASGLVEQPSPGGSPRLDAATDGLLSGLAGRLRSCGAALDGGAAPAPDAESDELAAGRSYATRARDGLAELLRDPAGRAESFLAWADRAFLARTLASAVSAVCGQTAIAVGTHGRSPPGAPGWLDPGALPQRGWDSWRRRIAANLTPRSIVMQDSVRLAVGLALARACVGIFDLQHGFWVMFATISVMKTTPQRTGSGALRTVAGTAAGAALSAGFIFAFGTGEAAYAVLLPVIVMISVVGIEFKNSLVFQAAFTILVVALFNLVKPVAWDLGFIRLEDVVVGAAAGIAIGLLVWPRGVGGQLRRSLAELLARASAYAVASARGLLGTDAAGESLDARRSDAARAALRAEDVFAIYVAERVGGRRDIAPWAEIAALGHQLWYAGDLAREHARADPPPAALNDLVAELDRLLRELRDDYATLARGLHAGAATTVAHDHDVAALTPGPLSSAGLRALRGAQPATARAAVRVYEVRAWTAELFEQLRRFEAAAASLARAGDRDTDDRAAPVSGAPARSAPTVS